MPFQIPMNVTARRVKMVADVLTWRTNTTADVRVVSVARIARKVRLWETTLFLSDMIAYPTIMERNSTNSINWVSWASLL